MTFKQIQDLIKLVNKSNISEIRIEEENFKITLRTTAYSYPARSKSDVQAPIAVPVQTVAQQTAPPSETPQQSAPAEKPEPQKEAPTTPSDEDKYVTVKSPMIGTFYRSSSPDKDPYVQIGDVVKKGTVLCIIEAMKLFNEIESEVEGKVVKVLAEDASPVEYDQPLFLIDPSAS